MYKLLVAAALRAHASRVGGKIPACVAARLGADGSRYQSAAPFPRLRLFSLLCSLLIQSYQNLPADHCYRLLLEH